MSWRNIAAAALGAALVAAGTLVPGLQMLSIPGGALLLAATVKRKR